jgi:hypothetical protein
MQTSLKAPSSSLHGVSDGCDPCESFTTQVCIIGSAVPPEPKTLEGWNAGSEFKQVIVDSIIVVGGQLQE